ncbi:MAG: thioredoxin family protein [Rubrivivax sp.]|nr:thioredoxin family protein [Rubrivivax sp.]
MQTDYPQTEPGRAEVDAQRGPFLLEFGSPWCGHCRRAQPLIAAALGAHPGLGHRKVADGPGLPLGRSFGVKLWPTLVFLRDGVEVVRAVRPQTQAEIDEGLRRIALPPAG